MTSPQKTTNCLENLESSESSEVLGPQKKQYKRIRYDHNPFLDGVVASFGDKSVKVAMKLNLAEIETSTGSITRIPGEIHKLVSADSASFVKLYSAQLDSFFELTGPARQVVKYLIFLHQQDPNNHLIGLHRAFALEQDYNIPYSTWFAGINTLLDKKFIAASKVTSVYFLNPAIFFNGDRTRFVTEIRKQHKQARVANAQPAQPSLEGFDEDAY